jgi:serine/threonine-protein kinase mTOR
VGSQPDVFYQSVVIQALLSILADASLATNHPDVIGVMLSIFKTQGLKCVPFLPQVIPAFVAMCRASHSRHQDFYVQQMSVIVEVIGSHIRNYLDEVFQLTRDLWPNPILHLPIVELIESLADAMGAEFKPYLPAVIPQLLTVFHQPEGTERSLAEVRVFQTMLSFGSAVEEYLHLILPFILATLERPTASRDSRRVAVETIGDLARRINLTESVSRIIQPLVRTLPAAEKSLRDAIMDTICVLLLQLGPDFAVFVPRIRNVCTPSQCDLLHPDDSTDAIGASHTSTSV